jgi:hypothetical protein
MRIPTRPGSAALLPLLVLVAGCGGAGEATPTTSTAAERPALPAPVVERLVAHSDAVALKLAAGDVCGAAQEADKLQGEYVAIVNEGGVPTVFQEEIGARVNELVDSVNCPPPPAPTETQAGEDAGGDDRGNGKANDRKKDKDKAKGHGKGKGKGGGDD